MAVTVTAEGVLAVAGEAEEVEAAEEMPAADSVGARSVVVVVLKAVMVQAAKVMVVGGREASLVVVTWVVGVLEVAAQEVG